MACLVSDNTSCNKRIGRLLQKLMIGCKSHLLDLEMKAFVKTNTQLNRIVEMVNELNKECHHLMNSASLKRLTGLRPRLANETRWSGIFEMLDRYDSIKGFIRTVAPDLANGTATVLPTVGQERNLAKNFSHS